MGRVLVIVEIHKCTVYNLAMAYYLNEFLLHGYHLPRSGLEPKIW